MKQERMFLGAALIVLLDAASPMVLDIPSLKLEKGKTFSLYLYGLISGVGDSKLGLQVLTHK